MARLITIGVILICASGVSSVRGADVRFVSGKSALAIPFQLEANVILLRVSINGSPSLSFIVDTGAYSVISTRHAKSLGMALQSVGKTDSLGTEPQDVYLVTDKASFSLPGVSFTGARLLAISLDKVQQCIDLATDGNHLPSGASEKPSPRIVLDGILGKEFFASFVVEIDYAARRLNVYDPFSYKYTGEGRSFPLEMDPQHIFVRARVKPPGRPPITARLLVDTGAATALRLTKQFTDANRLLPAVEKLAAVPECGLGGYTKTKAWEGTLDDLRLGNFKIRNPLTVFSREPIAEGYDGFLGGAALRNFKVVLDYSRRRMILERTRN